MSQPHDAARLTALGREWIAAWNSHDLERVLALYAEDSEMTSDKIQALGLDGSGTLRGKAMLRKYWTRAFEPPPNLHFELGQLGRVLPERTAAEDLRVSAAE